MYFDYKIRFDGAFTLDHPLSPDQAAYLERFFATRRVAWPAETLATLTDPVHEAVDLPAGSDGEYFVGFDFTQENLHHKIVPSVSTPPPGQPSIFCRWQLDPDHMTLRYVDTSNLALASLWLQYLLDHFFARWNYQLSGALIWQGDDEADRGTITIQESKVQNLLLLSKEEQQLPPPESPPVCAHINAHRTGFVCEHLTDLSTFYDYWKWFSGEGKEYALICGHCTADYDVNPSNIRLLPICWRCFKELDGAGCWEGFRGNPEIRIGLSELTLEIQTISLPLTEPLIALTPIDASTESIWIGLSKSGEIVRCDLTNQLITPIMHLPPSQLDLNSESGVSLHISSDGELAAIVNTKGRYGLVINLSSKTSTILLDRGDYYHEQTIFPCIFFEHADRALLIHGSDWNRLDISDPYTGALISVRMYEKVPERKNPEHYLDYFHGGLTLSPSQEWIADAGWFWMPVGAIQIWNLRRWVEENIWESEDGPSLRDICQRRYYWNGPQCWIDEYTLAVWGYGEDDLWLLPAIWLFDARSGKELGWFPGPESGKLVFDEYLFSLSKEHGLSAWKVGSEERVGWFPEFHPTHYHQGAKHFLQLDEQSNELQLGTVHQS